MCPCLLPLLWMWLGCFLLVLTAQLWVSCSFPPFMDSFYSCIYPVPAWPSGSRPCTSCLSSAQELHFFVLSMDFHALKFDFFVVWVVASFPPQRSSKKSTTYNVLSHVSEVLHRSDIDITSGTIGIHPQFLFCMPTCLAMTSTGRGRRWRYVHHLCTGMYMIVLCVNIVLKTDMNLRLGHRNQALILVMQQQQQCQKH